MARIPPTLAAASRQLDHILPGDRTCHLDRGYESIEKKLAGLGADIVRVKE